MKKRIIITTSFPAIHHWPGCPHEDVKYLRQQHRHVFHVTLKFEVAHDDREIEFIRKKNEVEEVIADEFYNKYIGSYSCEMLADWMLRNFGACYVKVMEDNENGAEVWR